MAGIENSPILLVTVTKVEAMAVLSLCHEKTGMTKLQRRVVDDKTYYDCGIIGGKPAYMVQSEMGTGTPGGALLTIHKAIESLKPSAVIMVGIAFGTRPDKQQLGDILVSRQIQSYEPQKVKGRGKIIPRGDRVTCSTALLDKFRSGELDWQGVPVHFGIVLSGEKLITDQATRDKLLKFEPEAIGGEMEGAGLYAAAADTKTDWILVKAICDFADGDKNDQAQPLAARNAASFVFHVLGQGGMTSRPVEHTSYSLSVPPCKEWTWEQKKTIVDALLACPCMATTQGRNDVVQQLSPNIRNAIHRADAPQFDVTNILSTCLNYDNGLQILSDAINFFERDSLSYRNLQKLTQGNKTSGIFHSINLAYNLPLVLVQVPGSDFSMGSVNSDSFAQEDEKPQHIVHLSEYYIGKYPITVAQFSVFVQARNYTTKAERVGHGYMMRGSWLSINGANWRQPLGKGSSVENKSQHPVTMVDWDDASAFTDWLNDEFCEQLPSGWCIRLPTEAQWEKAARGTKGFLWPWGNQPPNDSLCNFDRKADTTPVGQYSGYGGDSQYGCADMAGNVWEWCWDWYDTKPYKNRSGQTIHNPEGPAVGLEGAGHVLRGGSFHNTAGSCRCCSRIGYTRKIIAWNFGFRIACVPVV